MPRLFRYSRSTVVIIAFISFFTLYHIFSDPSSPSLGLDYLTSDTTSPHTSHGHPAARHGSWQDFFKANNDPLVGLGDARLELSSDGYLRGWDGLVNKLNDGSLSQKEKKALRGMTEKHPIEILIEKGEKRWSDLLARQSKTLPQAVMEYRKRYGRAPPKGFEGWWHFCRENNVKIVDDYDQIYKDIQPYYALSPALFRERVERLHDTDASYFITLHPNGSHLLDGQRAGSSRGKGLHTLLTPLAPLLPTSLTIHMSDHDLGSWILAEDQRAIINQAITDGRYLTEEELKPYEQRVGRAGVEVKGQSSACKEDSLAWKMSLARQNKEPWEWKEEGTRFIHNAIPTYDFCNNLQLHNHHGGLSWDHPRESQLRPIFQLSKFSRNPEFLTTPLEAYENHTSASAQGKYAPWESKTIDKVFWRGSSTGDSYFKRENYDWRRSHRPHLALMTQAEEGKRKIWVDRAGEWKAEEWSMKDLNEKYMDVGLAGKPHQCRSEDGTCGEMTEEIHFKPGVGPEEAAKYKYQLDVDGNGWSSRFHRLLMSGSVVVKATIYPEWHSDWMTPWVHYVPTQVDYSDLYSIMSFFAGPPDGTSGRDDLAKRISENGRKFGEEHWRWEDMQAYMLRLLLEYARLQADDREAFSYDKTY